MRYLTLIAFGLLTSGCVMPVDNTDRKIENHIVMGADAAKLDMKDTAIAYYSRAIEMMKDDKSILNINHPTKPWKAMVSRLKWEEGDDVALIDYSKSDLDKALSLKWWCLILEKRGKNDSAEVCWSEYGDENRRRRVVRTQQIIDVLGDGHIQYKAAD